MIQEKPGKPDRISGIDSLETVDDNVSLYQGTDKSIANMDEIDFLTLLAEQANR